MKKFEKRHLENWPKTRAKGRKKYSLQMTVIMTIGIVVLKSIDYLTFNFTGVKNIFATLLFFGIFWFICTFLMNYFWLWKIEEEYFNKLLKKQSKESDSPKNKR